MNAQHSRFNVGDRVRRTDERRWRDAGGEGTVTRVEFATVWVDWGDGDEKKYLDDALMPV